MIDSFSRIKKLIVRFQDLSALGTANVISSIALAAFWFFLASLLGTDGYGELTYLVAGGSIAVSVSNFGVINTIIVFTAKEKRTQSAIHFLALISGSVASVVTFLIFHNIGLSLFVICFVIFFLTTSELLGRKLYKDYAKFMIFQRILQVVLGIGLFYVIGIDGILIGWALSYLTFSFKLFKFIRSSKVDFTVLKFRFGFMLNNYGIGLSRDFGLHVHKLIIFSIFGAALLGNYQLGFQVLLVLSILPHTVFQYILPKDSLGEKTTKLKKLLFLYQLFSQFLQLL